MKKKKLKNLKLTKRTIASMHTIDNLKGGSSISILYTMCALSGCRNCLAP